MKSSCGINKSSCLDCLRAVECIKHHTVHAAQDNCKISALETGVLLHLLLFLDGLIETQHGFYNMHFNNFNIYHNMST
jgi:hypothetical protein